GAGADLDDAARDHLARARAAARHVGVEIDVVSGLEAGESRGEIEGRVSERGPPRERLAVLGFLRTPAPRRRLELRVVGEDAAEVMRVGVAIIFDEARRLDDAQELGIDA